MASVPDVLTDLDLQALRLYAAGHDIADIADQLGEKRETLGLRMAGLCNLNRNRARELTKHLPPLRRPAGRRTDPDPVELDRVDRAFAQVFAGKSPQLEFLVDAARALSAACDRELVPGVPMEAEIRGVDLAVAALDGTAAQPSPQLEARESRNEIQLEPLERLHTWYCHGCGFLGLPDQHTGCEFLLEPVALLVVPREAAPCR